MWAWLETHSLVVSLILSMAAFCVSGFSLWLTWRRDKQSERATYPLVELHVAPNAIEPGIHSVLLTVTNRREHHMHVLNYAVRRPRTAAFVRLEDHGHEPPIIHRDQRDRVGTERVYLSERGKPGARWGIVRYLDIGSEGKAVTILFNLEFDFVDTPKRTLRYSIKRKLGRASHDE